ncbi:hypothetical protein [Terrabacter terrae]|uniref:hypothetical protein n=1 Tax=Terrabacter terrae TaxID=318434 RepID=UPI0031D845B4
MRSVRAAAVSVACGAAVVLGGCTSASGSPPAGTSAGTPVELSTHCGIRFLQVGDDWFERVGGPLARDGNPPPGWGNPTQPGRVTRAGRDAVFTDDAGHHELFGRVSAPPASATACA